MIFDRSTGYTLKVNLKNGLTRADMANNAEFTGEEAPAKLQEIEHMSNLRDVNYIKRVIMKV